MICLLGLFLRIPSGELQLLFSAKNFDWESFDSVTEVPTMRLIAAAVAAETLESDSMIIFMRLRVLTRVAVGLFLQPRLLQSFAGDIFNLFSVLRKWQIFRLIHSRPTALSCPKVLLLHCNIFLIPLKWVQEKKSVLIWQNKSNWRSLHWAGAELKHKG